MNISTVLEKIPTSPAYIFDADAIIQSLQGIDGLRAACGCKLLYSIKSLPLQAVLELVKPYVDGFSVSSLFEARLAQEILSEQKAIHLTTPGLRRDEAYELCRLCSHISANSLSQFELLSKINDETVSLGLRVNPGLSFTEDDRYDPCRSFSKLGVPLADVNKNKNVNKINGLHFHTVFGQTGFEALLQTLDKLEHLSEIKLNTLKWLNLGGGYLYGQIADTEELVNKVNKLRQTYDLDVFIEPGNAVIGHAGYLLTTVIDRFASGGKTVAVLDTSVNHHPEIFEYQKSPQLAWPTREGRHSAILAGSTCLAGDLFGEYRFDKPLQIGDRLVFKHVGAYSLVKANRFNGYNLPDVYWHSAGCVNLIKTYSYGDFRQLWLNDQPSTGS